MTDTNVTTGSVTTDTTTVAAAQVAEKSVLNTDAAAVATDKAAEAVKDGDKQEGKDGKTDKPAAGAPEKYEAFKMPDGVEIDPDLTSNFHTVAKDLNLSQDQAQKLVDLQANAMKKLAESQQESWEGLKQTWMDSAKSDKEYGGQAFNENVAVAKKAVEAFATSEFKEMLDATGTGNHPEMVRFMYRVGKAISEDKLRIGDSPRGQRDLGSVLYDKSNMK